MTTGTATSRRALILSPGEAFGAYTILAPLGRGGMGEVYRARDNRLGREVALKILPDEEREDPERVRRFEQEARAASALAHPNIVVVFESGEAVPAGRERPVPFLAMELLEGQPLHEILLGGKLPVKRALQYVSQIADGLARAHESGIVHRDLKPSNVIVSRDGHVKILDFGLAKVRAFAPEDKTLDVVSDPTFTSPGTMLGTVGYMSPEQVRGENAAPASDQFSLGCILFEMLTGERPFQRNSPAETLSAILRDEPPPIPSLNPDVPIHMGWIVERCLAKVPRDRYASTRDMARDLQKLRETGHDPSFRSLSVALKTPRRRRALRLATGAVFAVAAAAAAAWVAVARTRPSAPPVFQQLTFRQGIVWRALFAPKTGAVLFTAAWQDGPTRLAMTLPESEGVDRVLEAAPLVPMSFSPDGSEILVLFGSYRLPDGRLNGTLARMPVLGGRPRKILDDAGWADWSKGGTLLAAVRNEKDERVLELRDSDGGLRRTLFRTRGAVSWIRFSPDDRWIAYFEQLNPQSGEGRVSIVAVGGGEPKALTPLMSYCGGLNWNAETGEIWFSVREASQTRLEAVALSGKRRTVYTFPEEVVLQDIQPQSQRCLVTLAGRKKGTIVLQNGDSPRDLSWFTSTRVTDVSPDRTLLLLSEDTVTAKHNGAWIRPVDGGEAAHLGGWEPGRFSPDGAWIIGVSHPDTPRAELVLFPVDAGASRALPTPGIEAGDPSFAGPDVILFVGSEGGRSRVWRIRIDGTGLEAIGAEDCTMPMADPSLSSFVCQGAPAYRGIWVYPMAGGPGRRLYENPASRISYARFNSRGDRILAATRASELLTLDAATGAVLARKALPVPAGLGYAELIDAAFDPDASLKVYSVNLYSSRLFLVTGLR